MKRPLLLLSAAAITLALGSGCSIPGPASSAAVPASPDLPETMEALPAEATSPEPPPTVRVPPPKPSLARLTDRSRPQLDFHGATIYADSIQGWEAVGNVFLDGSALHRMHRSFPKAVYADRLRVDPVKGEVILSGWPIVETDTAFVQAQSPDTVISLDQSRLAQIDGPARYVMGDKGGDLFRP